jgi:cytochrome oxidase assembly protein ShyY1
LRGLPRADKAAAFQEIHALAQTTKSLGKTRKLVTPFGRQRSASIIRPRGFIAFKRSRMANKNQLHQKTSSICAAD